MIRYLKNVVRDGVVHRWWRRQRDLRQLREWRSSGQPLPPPQAYKRELILSVARRYGVRVLVETGTHYGHTLAASLSWFTRLYSVELFDEHYARACVRFAKFPQVHLRQGDSSVELAKIVDELREPALFWLDAHYSGEGTARGVLDSPIVRELQTIADHRLKNHVILIDDAREFTGQGGYPTIETCRQLAQQHWPKHSFNVSADIIEICPHR